MVSSVFIVESKRFFFEKKKQKTFDLGDLGVETVSV